MGDLKLEGVLWIYRAPPRAQPSGTSSSSSFNGHPMPGLGHPHGHGSNSSASGMGASRRGHHHKHSLSHNFFSFLEPGTGGPQTSRSEQELYTQPTPNPMSPWNPISPFPKSAGLPPGSAIMVLPSPSHHYTQSQSHFPSTPTPVTAASLHSSSCPVNNAPPPFVLPFTVIQFLIGSVHPCVGI